MRTTLAIDGALLEKARRLSGIEEKTALVREALKVLIARTPRAGTQTLPPYSLGQEDGFLFPGAMDFVTVAPCPREHFAKSAVRGKMFIQVQSF